MGICIEMILRDVHSILDDGNISEVFEDSDVREVFEDPETLTCTETQRSERLKRINST